LYSSHASRILITHFIYVTWKAWRSSRSFTGQLRSKTHRGALVQKTSGGAAGQNAATSWGISATDTRVLFSACIRLRGKFSSKIVLLATYMYSTVICLDCCRIFLWPLPEMNIRYQSWGRTSAQISMLIAFKSPSTCDLFRCLTLGCRHWQSGLWLRLWLPLATRWTKRGWHGVQSKYKNITPPFWSSSAASLFSCHHCYSMVTDSGNRAPRPAVLYNVAIGSRNHDMIRDSGHSSRASRSSSGNPNIIACLAIRNLLPL